jgi:hypothetical protein
MSPTTSVMTVSRGRGSVALQRHGRRRRCGGTSRSHGSCGCVNRN